jgi:hypothetical protein
MYTITRNIATEKSKAVRSNIGRPPFGFPRLGLSCGLRFGGDGRKRGERSTRMPGEDGEFVESRTEYEGGAGVGFQFRREKRRWSEW